MMTSPIRPLHDNIVVRLIERPKESAGGVLLPETAALDSQEGVVIAVGRGKLNPDGSREPMTLKTGDRVLVNHWAGQGVPTEGEDWLLFHESDVVGLVQTDEGVSAHDAVLA